MIIVIIIAAIVLALTTLWVLRTRNTPIAEDDLDRRLADIRETNNDETPHQRAVREESLNLILASDKLAGNTSVPRRARERRRTLTSLVSSITLAIGAVVVVCTPAVLVWFLMSGIVENVAVSSLTTAATLPATLLALFRLGAAMLSARAHVHNSNALNVVACFLEKRKNRLWYKE